MNSSVVPAFGQSSRHHPSVPSRVLALVLATFATGISAWISIIAGSERGGATSERVAWAAVGLVLLLGAHLIPAFTKGSALPVRVVAMLLWLVCMLSTGYGHATFFLSAQRHAGEVRATLVQQEMPPIAAPMGRAPDAIARDEARVTRALLLARSTHCTAHCEALDVRRESLAAQLAALGAEANEARRREAAADRDTAAREALKARADLARNDPVTARVADTLGMHRDMVDLVTALAFGWLLEGVACLGWMVALANPVRTSGNPEDAAVSSSNAKVIASSASVVASLAASEAAVAVDTEHEDLGTGSDAAGTMGSAGSERRLNSVVNAELVQLTGAIADGRVRPTVKDIRRFMQCSQAKAMRLRHQFLAIASDGSRDRALPEAPRVGVTPARPRLVHSFADQSQAA